MILKYKVPEEERHLYHNKKVIYCDIKESVELDAVNKIMYRVDMINLYNWSNIYVNADLKKLNILDKIKLKIEGVI